MILVMMAAVVVLTVTTIAPAKKIRLDWIVTFKVKEVKVTMKEEDRGEEFTNRTVNDVSNKHSPRWEI